MLSERVLQVYTLSRRLALRMDSSLTHCEDTGSMSIRCPYFPKRGTGTWCASIFVADGIFGDLHPSPLSWYVNVIA